VFPKHFQPHTRTFLAGLLERDPALRFGISEIKAHPFFTGVDWDKLLNKEYAAPVRIMNPPVHSLIDHFGGSSFGLTFGFKCNELPSVARR